MSDMRDTRRPRPAEKTATIDVRNVSQIGSSTHGKFRFSVYTVTRCKSSGSLDRHTIGMSQQTKYVNTSKDF